MYSWVQNWFNRSSCTNGRLYMHKARDHLTALTFRTHLAKITCFNAGALEWTLGYVVHSAHHVNLESILGTHAD